MAIVSMRRGHGIVKRLIDGRSIHEPGMFTTIAIYPMPSRANRTAETVECREARMFFHSSCRVTLFCWV